MSEKVQPLLRGLRRVIALEKGTGLGDAELLRRFVSQHDEAAFEVLVWRHAATVLGVCRRVLRQPQDVEDAFQATFLVFLRKSVSIRRPEVLGSWLHRVAYHIALRARLAAARRTQQEGHCLHEATAQFSEDRTTLDLRPLLDEELNHLPEKYRTPLVLCYLEGMNKEEIAGVLGCPVGTVSSRLARGRERLRIRLARRGLTLALPALATGLAEASLAVVPPMGFVQSALKVLLELSAGNAPLTAGFTIEGIALAQGVLRAMWMSKLRLVVAVIVGLGVTVGGAGALLDPSVAAQEKSIPAQTGKLEQVAATSGSRWEVAPREGITRGFFTSDRMLGSYVSDQTGAVVVTLSYPAQFQKSASPSFRPVALDANNKRYLFKQEMALSNKHLLSYQFRLDPAVVPADRITRIGIEEIQSNGK